MSLVSRWVPHVVVVPLGWSRTIASEQGWAIGRGSFADAISARDGFNSE